MRPRSMSTRARTSATSRSGSSDGMPPATTPSSTSSASAARPWMPSARASCVAITARTCAGCSSSSAASRNRSSLAAGSLKSHSRSIICCSSPRWWDGSAGTWSVESSTPPSWQRRRVPSRGHDAARRASICCREHDPHHRRIRRLAHPRRAALRHASHERPGARGDLLRARGPRRDRRRLGARPLRRIRARSASRRPRRGAAEVVLVEKAKAAADVCRRNADAITRAARGAAREPRIRVAMRGGRVLPRVRASARSTSSSSTRPTTSTRPRSRTTWRCSPRCSRPTRSWSSSAARARPNRAGPRASRPSGDATTARPRCGGRRRSARAAVPAGVGSHPSAPTRPSVDEDAAAPRRRRVPTTSNGAGTARAGRERREQAVVLGAGERDPQVGAERRPVEVEVDAARLGDPARVAREPVGDVEHRGRAGERRPRRRPTTGGSGASWAATSSRMPRAHVGRACRRSGSPAASVPSSNSRREAPRRVAARAGVRHDVARRAHRSAARAPGPRGRRTPSPRS